jgi:hypothetical protein
MAQLVATKNELKQAFQKHYSLYKKLEPINSHQLFRRLILFYAVEIGLKYYLLDIIKKNNTEELKQYHGYEYLSTNGHDIKQMLKSTKCGSQFTLASFTVKNGQQVEPYQFHQLWRYGIVDNSTVEAEAEDKLKKIANWLEGEITRRN